jgi:hypothetical protein
MTLVSRKKTLVVSTWKWGTEIRIIKNVFTSDIDNLNLSKVSLVATTLILQQIAYGHMHYPDCALV